MPPISDALSTLSDRGLRRLLGARTFLRGLEYFRRRVVEDINVEDTTASGTVPASDSEPYPVKVEPRRGRHQVAAAPARRSRRAASTASTSAALLISIRDQARAAQPRREPPIPAMVPQTAHAGGGDALKRVRRRDRIAAGARR